MAGAKVHQPMNAKAKQALARLWRFGRILHQIDDLAFGDAADLIQMQAALPFLRFRVAYKYTDRSPQTRDAFNLNDASARKLDEILFQASFILGAHPAHPF